MVAQEHVANRIGNISCEINHLPPFRSNVFTPSNHHHLRLIRMIDRPAAMTKRPFFDWCAVVT